MVRKARTADTAAGAVGAMLAAAAPSIQPPSHCALRKEDMAFWRGIVDARARDEWTDANLVIAAQLARCQRDIEEQQNLLYTEGHIVVNERGTPIANPRHTVLEKMSTRELALMRSLNMVGVAVADKRDLAGKRKIEQQSRKLREELEDDPLLA